MLITRGAAHMKGTSGFLESMIWKNCRGIFDHLWYWLILDGEIWRDDNGTGNIELSTGIGNQKQVKNWHPVFETLQNSNMEVHFCNPNTTSENAIFIFVFDRLMPIGRSKMKILIKPGYHKNDNGEWTLKWLRWGLRTLTFFLPTLLKFRKWREWQNAIF